MEILWNTGSGGGGTGTGFAGIVQVFSDLPVDDSAEVGEVWLVREGEGLWFFDRHPRGLYQRIDDTGVRETDWQYLGEWQEQFSDANFQVYNASDETKVMKLDVSTVATGTVRTLTVPNEDGTIALLSDVSDALSAAVAYTDAAIAGLTLVYQPLDADLTAIANLSSTGYARRTGAGAWTLDSSIPIGSLSMATARILGRTTAGSGAVEELTAGSSLSLAAGSLNTIQDIRTTAAMQLERLGLGVAADPALPLLISTSGVGAEIYSETGQADFHVTTYGSGGLSGIMHGRGARGTRASPSALLAGDGIGGYGGRGWDGTTWSGSKASIHMITTENWSGTNQGARMRLLTTPAGGTTRYPFFEFTDIGVAWTHGQSSDFNPLDTTHFRPAADMKATVSETGAGATMGALSWGGDAGFRSYAAGGSVATPAATPLNRLVGFLSAAGHDGTNWTGSKGLASFIASENWGASANGMDWRLSLTPAGSTSRADVLLVRGTGVAEFTNYIHVARTAGVAVEELRLAVIGAAVGDGAAINFLHSTTERSGRIYARALSTNIGEVRIASGDSSAYTDVANFAAGAVDVYGTIKTAAPSGGTAQPWLFGEAASVSPTAPNRTVRVSINGTILYLHAKTTND